MESIVEYAPHAASLTTRLGGEARVALIAHRLIGRMRADPVLERLVEGIRINDLRLPLDALVARWSVFPSWELHLPMIVGHLIATLMELKVQSEPARDLLYLVEGTKQSTRAA